MNHVGLLLHFYQPPTQAPETLRRIDAECYRPVFKLLGDTGAPVTVNINFSLMEQLARYCPETMEMLGEVRGCEFTDSGGFHPLFPLIPEAETIRQLAINRDGNRSLLAGYGRPRGVFPPEMALDGATAAVLSREGYQWTITDDVPWVWTGREAPATWVPVFRGIRVLLRSNFWSNLISFHGDDGSLIADRLVKEMRRWIGREDSYIIIAMDGETFGHHRPGSVEGFLHPFIKVFEKAGGATLSTAGDIALGFPGREADIPDGSWSTSPEDMDRGVPFPLWDDPDNPDHKSLRSLLNTVLERARQCDSPGVARLADEMLYSCPFWWASSGRYCSVQVRRGIAAILETALAIARECSDRSFLDTAMTMAGEIPGMTRKDH